MKRQTKYPTEQIANMAANPLNDMPTKENRLEYALLMQLASTLPSYDHEWTPEAKEQWLTAYFQLWERYCALDDREAQAQKLRAASKLQELIEELD